MRNVMSPVKEFVGHTKGMAFCKMILIVNLSMSCQLAHSLWKLRVNTSEWHLGAVNMSLLLFWWCTFPCLQGRVPIVNSSYMFSYCNVHSSEVLMCNCLSYTGVIAMSWCPIDSSYLLTCAKDNRTICWDTVTGEVGKSVCELWSSSFPLEPCNFWSESLLSMYFYCDVFHVLTELCAIVTLYWLLL